MEPKSSVKIVRANKDGIICLEDSYHPKLDVETLLYIRSSLQMASLHV